MSSTVNSYEELLNLVEERRQERLILEVDLGSDYSEEHEEAKEALQQAQAIGTLSGNSEFLSDNLVHLKKRVEETRPPSKSVWIAFKRLDLKTWAMLVKKASQGNVRPIEQYEQTLDKTFLGVYSSPEATKDTLLTEDKSMVSSSNDNGILTGGLLNEVVSTFMSWQNSGGRVKIHPTKSGQD